MRCFEITVMENVMCMTLEINNNMRCFEIKLSKEQAIQRLDKQ